MVSWPILSLGAEHTVSNDKNSMFGDKSYYHKTCLEKYTRQGKLFDLRSLKILVE